MVVLNSERLAQRTGRPDEEIAYSVSYFDLPGQVTVSRGQLIEIARKNFAVEAVSVLSEAEVSVSGYAGREMVVDLDGQMARAVRVLPAGKRMFYVVAEGDRDVVLGDEAQRFLKSFNVYSGWDPHDGEEFAVDVPTLSSHSVAWRQVAGMPTQYDLFDLDRGDNPPVQYFVAQTHLPADAVSSTSPELLLRLTETALHEGTEVIERKSVYSGNWPARHYNVRLPDGGSGELRIVIARSELYQLGVLTPASGGIPASDQRFFSSFGTASKSGEVNEMLSEVMGQESGFGPPGFLPPGGDTLDALSAAEWTAIGAETVSRALARLGR